MENEELIPLPEGVTVKDEFCVGVNYMYKGQIIAQHPKDTNAMRRYLWMAFEEKRGRLGKLMGE